MKLMKKGFVCVPGGWRGLGVVEGGGRGGGEAGVLTRPMFNKTSLNKVYAKKIWRARVVHHIGAHRFGLRERPCFCGPFYGQDLNIIQDYSP